MGETGDRHDRGASAADARFFIGAHVEGDDRKTPDVSGVRTDGEFRHVKILREIGLEVANLIKGGGEEIYLTA